MPIKLLTRRPGRVIITVTLFCRHDDGYGNHVAVEGTRVYIDRDGVALDGQRVIRRDRRPTSKREMGHPWLGPDGTSWTGFSVTVES